MMDFSNRRYNKPKVLKKKKDLNKYKRNVNQARRENPSDRISISLSNLNKAQSTSAPGMVKVNREERLTVNRGLFDDMKKSKLASRDAVNRSNREARLNEDLDALIPSCKENKDSPAYDLLDEQNNNIPGQHSQNFPVIWETQPDSDLIQVPSPLSANQNRSQHSLSPAPRRSRNQTGEELQPKPHVSRNQNRSRRSFSPARKTSTNHKQSHGSLNGSQFPSRSIDYFTPDSYPRTRAYVNAQQQRLEKMGVKAFESSSESDNEVQSLHSTSGVSKSQLEMIHKYLELTSYLEKSFVPIKRKVFKDAPCRDYFKQLKSELWESYRETGQKAELSKCNSQESISNKDCSQIGEVEILLSSSSESNQYLPQQQPNQGTEFTFSPKMEFLSDASNSSECSRTTSVLPPTERDCSFLGRPGGTAQYFEHNENDFGNMGRRTYDSYHSRTSSYHNQSLLSGFHGNQSSTYQDNDSGSWSNPNLQSQRSPPGSPELQVVAKRPRLSYERNRYQSDSTSWELGNNRHNDSHQDRNHDALFCEFESREFNRRSPDLRHMDRRRSIHRVAGTSKDSVIHYADRFLQSRNRDQVKFKPRRSNYGIGTLDNSTIDVITLDSNDDQDLSPPIKLYPRKLF